VDPGKDVTSDLHYAMKIMDGGLNDPLHNMQWHGQKFRQQRRQQCRKILGINGTFRWTPTATI
jgi:hypothetical protein